MCLGNMLKHYVALPLIITAPRMQLIQSTWINAWITTKVSERWRAGNIVMRQRRSENVGVASPK